MQNAERGNTIAIVILLVAVLAGAGYWYFTGPGAVGSPDPAGTTPVTNTPPASETTQQAAPNETADASVQPPEPAAAPVSITPIQHATLVMEWSGTIMYVDPVGGAAAFADQPVADVILMTDTDPDHFSTSTLAAVAGENTTIIAPQAVADVLSENLRAQTIVMENGDAETVADFELTAIPMYNLPADEPDPYHPKGKGNGYVIDDGSYRLYLAGDTEATPEFRAQENIDLAIVPMNLPYTMGVEQAADGVLEMAPRSVYPYHFRTPEGFSDVREFERLVTTENPAIEVVILDWYPERDTGMSNS